VGKESRPASGIRCALTAKFCALKSGGGVYAAPAFGNVARIFGGC
jgi:hypothetical protein